MLLAEHLESLGDLGSNITPLEMATGKVAVGKRMSQLAAHRQLNMPELSVLSQIEYSNLFAYTKGEANISKQFIKLQKSLKLFLRQSLIILLYFLIIPS